MLEFPALIQIQYILQVIYAILSICKCFAWWWWIFNLSSYWWVFERFTNILFELEIDSCLTEMSSVVLWYLRSNLRLQWNKISFLEEVNPNKHRWPKMCTKQCFKTRRTLLCLTRDTVGSRQRCTKPYYIIDSRQNCAEPFWL